MRNFLLYVDNILECINKIELYSKEISREEFHTNSEKQDAVLRRLEVIGEAVKKLPVKAKKSIPKYPEKVLQV